MKKLLVFVVLVAGCIFPVKSFSGPEKIKGYWKISLTESFSYVEKTCGVYMKEVEKGKRYRFTMFNYFDTKHLAQIEVSKTVLGMSSTHVPLEEINLFFGDDARLMSIGMSFGSDLFDPLKKTITENWGKPGENLKIGNVSGSKWKFDNSCVILKKFKKDNKDVVELDIKFISWCGK